ncbi:MAG: hypothetical protein QM813_15280 [Verrucomicrobiota bacterium]
MKNNGMTTILNYALLAGAVALLVSGFKYYNKTKTLRTYQVVIGQATGLQNTEQLVRGLLAESVEYAKTNPSLTPVLDSLMTKQPAAKPGASPAATKK